ncbi:MAG: 3-deoxy-manno-octulosonate cytidylyltransferase [Phycisphaerae bacterium]
MSNLIVIPARYESTRLPGKPLLKQSGKYLIEHVYERAVSATRARAVIVATDDARILKAVKSFGGSAVLTSSAHTSGTDRIAEVAQMPEYQNYERIVNLQGDEPEVDPGLIDSLFRILENTDVPMATAAAPFDDADEILLPNVVKVVVDQRRFAMYFSRSVIPYDRDGIARDASRLMLAGLYRKHLGVYAYRREFLLELSRTEPCELEKMEKLEQLRALYMGAKIIVHDTPQSHHGIDTPEDYAAFLIRQGISSA